MRVIEVIPFKSFRQKMAIVKTYEGKARIEIHSNYIYVEHTKGAYN